MWARGQIGTALWVFTLVHFVLWGALFATYFTYAADLAPPERRTEGIAIFGVAGLLSSGIGPALGEIVLDHGGYPGLFLVADRRADRIVVRLFVLHFFEGDLNVASA